MSLSLLADSYFSYNVLVHLTLTGRHITLTPALKAYAEEKFMALFARLATAPEVAQAMHVNIEMSRQTQHHRKGEIWKAAATITLPRQKRPLHASVTHEDIYAAIDLLVEETERELNYQRGHLRALILRSARAFKRLLRIDPAAHTPRPERERNEGG